MRDYDPTDPFGSMPEIPAPKQEPNDDDIIGIHIVGCIYGVVGIACLLVLASLLIYLL